MMRLDIQQKLAQKRVALLAELKQVPRVKVQMEGSQPSAIAFPGSLLFDGGITFHLAKAETFLELLSELTFTMGNSLVWIYPERSSEGTRLLDMRRAVAVSGYLVRSGVAPPRVQTQLTSGYEIPTSLANLSGILVRFLPGESPNLNSVEPGTEGPVVSLGVSPREISPDKGEGAVIEFSAVSDKPLASWRFQLSASEGGKSLILQEMAGQSAVYHQIFWNGRREYFGSLVSPGNYECVLRAVDTHGREALVRQWIAVSLGRGEDKASLPQNRFKEISFQEGLEELGEPVPIKKAPLAKRKVSGRKRAKSRLASPVKPPKGREEAPEQATLAAAVSYQIYFPKNSMNINGEGERVLQQLVDAATLYPLEKLNLVGYAFPQEINPGTLADRRARVIENLLVDRYHLSPDRVLRHTAKIGTSPRDQRVEIFIAR